MQRHIYKKHTLKNIQSSSHFTVFVRYYQVIKWPQKIYGTFRTSALVLPGARIERITDSYHTMISLASPNQKSERKPGTLYFQAGKINKMM